MKKLISTLLAIFLVIDGLSAQDKAFAYGPRLMIGSSNFESGDLKGDFGKLLIGGGMQGFYTFNPVFSIGAEGLLTLKGSRGKTTESSTFGGNSTYLEKYQLLYVEVPIIAKITIPSGDFCPKGFIGFSNNFFVTGTYSKTYTSGNGNDQAAELVGLDVLEQSLVMGAGFDIKAGDGIYSIDFRLSKGLSRLSGMPGNAATATNNYYAIGVAAAF